jgi:hypothetical protein
MISAALSPVTFFPCDQVCLHQQSTFPPLKRLPRKPPACVRANLTTLELRKLQSPTHTTAHIIMRLVHQLPNPGESRVTKTNQLVIILAD